MLLPLLIRILSGERYRKATPAELRWASAVFAFIPVWGALGIYLGHSYLDHANPFGIWIFMMSCLLIAFIWLYVWTRFVPAMASWILGAIIWLAVLVLAFTGHIGPK